MDRPSYEDAVMPLSAANSVSAIAALIALAQTSRPADHPGDGPYFGSPNDNPAPTPPPAQIQGQVRISGIDPTAAAGTPQASSSAVGLAAYTEQATD
jgi:hypothetical protein